MVQFTSIIAALALTPIIGASPVDTSSQPELFSFEKWVDDIISNPDGDHLSPEEALAARQKSVQEGADDLPSTQAIICYNSGTPAPAPDAVNCINYLAGLGGRACAVTATTSEFCRAGRAVVTGYAPSGRASSSCQDVARGAGRIMDQCFRSDNTVHGENAAWGHGNLIVRINGA